MHPRWACGCFLCALCYLPGQLQDPAGGVRPQRQRDRVRGHQVGRLSGDQVVPGPCSPRCAGTTCSTSSVWYADYSSARQAARPTGGRGKRWGKFDHSEIDSRNLAAERRVSSVLPVSTGHVTSAPPSASPHPATHAFPHTVRSLFCEPLTNTIRARHTLWLPPLPVAAAVCLLPL